MFIQENPLKLPKSSKSLWHLNHSLLSPSPLPAHFDGNTRQEKSGTKGFLHPHLPVRGEASVFHILSPSYLMEAKFLMGKAKRQGQSKKALLK